MTKDDFLPQDYEVPKTADNYMKLQEGDNTFRILEKPIMGEEYWVDNKPVRVRLGVPIKIEEVPEPDKIKHFWAMIVWNYELNRIQILELTQKNILRAIKDYARNAKWGSPLNYDLVIKRTKTGSEARDVQYSVIALPKEPLTKEIEGAYKKANIDVSALFDGNDPFALSGGDDMPTDDKGEPINIDNIPF